jgi:hypothetical protein
MSIECKAPVGLVPIERRWPKALAALFRRIRPGTGFRKNAPPKEAKS